MFVLLFTLFLIMFFYVNETFGSSRLWLRSRTRNISTQHVSTSHDTRLYGSIGTINCKITVNTLWTELDSTEHVQEAKKHGSINNTFCIIDQLPLV